MKQRLSIVLGILCLMVCRPLWAAPALADPSVNTMEPPPAAASPTAPSAPAAPASSCTGFCNGIWTQLVTIGPGLPAVSIRFDGKLGFADRVAPLELGLNLFQYQYHPTADNAHAGAHYFTLWRVSLGLTVTKDPDTSNVTFGAYISPFGVQIDQFAFGLGLAYSAAGQVTSNNNNFAVIVPFSYSFTLGN